MKNVKWKIQAFTLIELLIILTITAFLFTIGFAQYRSFARRQVLTNAHEKLKSDLNLARQLALSGEKINCTSGTTLEGYKITVTNTTRYTINAQCRDLNNSITSPRANEVEENLPSGITLTYTTGNILFKVIGQGTDLSSSAILTLSQSGNQLTKTVTITKEGLIQ